MAEVHGIRMKSPAHSGGFVKSEVIEALELSVMGAARALGVTRSALSAVLNERARLSPEMALRIEKARSAYRWTRSCGCRTATTSRRPA